MEYGIGWIFGLRTFIVENYMEIVKQNRREQDIGARCALKYFHHGNFGGKQPPPQPILQTPPKYLIQAASRFSRSYNLI